MARALRDLGRSVYTLYTKPNGGTMNDEETAQDIREIELLGS